MSKISRALVSTLVLSALSYVQAAQADCHRNDDVPTTNIYMDIGRVVISPNANVGDVIFSREFTSDAGAEPNYVCDRPQDVTFTSRLINQGADVGNGIYATNIKGVGIRISRVGKGIDLAYPGTHTRYGEAFKLAGSVVKMELVKTAEVTGSGSLTEGKYSTYSGPVGSPILETFISGGGITIVSPSCRIVSDKVMSVNMTTAYIDSFKGVGTTVGKVPFSIDLICSGDASINGGLTINTTFSGNTPTGLDKTSGVLVNEDESSSTADGIGFQITSNGQPIAFDKKYLVGKITENTERNFTFPLAASYYQYGSNPTSGRVTSHMTYNITYD